MSSAAGLSGEQAGSTTGGAGLQAQLQSAGEAFTSVAVSCLCNNPSCANVTGMSEQGLVSGRSCVCSGCRTARYCGRLCQRQHWKHHKPA